MSDEASQAVTQFTKQRRNLLIISLLLIFTQFADLEIKNDITVFGGVVVAIGNPLALSVSVWFLWAYWLYRYYVYQMEVGRNKLTARQDENFRKQIQRNVYMLMKFDPNVERILVDENKEYVGSSAQEFVIKQVNIGKDVHISAPSLTITRKTRDHSPTLTASTFSADYVAVIPWNKVAPYHGKAKYTSVIDTPIVSEYYFPYIVAITPVLLLVSRWLQNYIKDLF